jgi:hypothetical protein
MSYSVVQGDTAPAMVVTASVNGGAPPTNYFPPGTTATMRWEKPSGAVVEALALDVVDLAAGTWSRTWEAGDTDEVGQHYGQLVVLRPDLTTETFPSNGDFMTWYVNPKLPG